MVVSKTVRKSWETAGGEMEKIATGIANDIPFTRKQRKPSFCMAISITLFLANAFYRFHGSEAAASHSIPAKSVCHHGPAASLC